MGGRLMRGALAFGAGVVIGATGLVAAAARRRPAVEAVLESDPAGLPELEAPTLEERWVEARCPHCGAPVVVTIGYDDRRRAQVVASWSCQCRIGLISQLVCLEEHL